jgi:hypothetical protein
MDVMLDLETLGTTPGCVILSIGAVAFDSTTVLATFEAHLDARSCQRAGLTIDADTVMWWLGREEAARAALIHGPAIPLHDALAQFTLWLNAGERTIRLWSKGPSFDAAVLGAAYRAAGLVVPWDFRQERCVRTILDLTGVDGGDHREMGEPRHQALADALAQTRAVQEALRRIPGSVSTAAVEAGARLAGQREA